MVDGAAVPWPPHIRPVSVDGVEGEVATAPPGAFYLVLTHRHDLDLRIAEAILRRADFGFFGLIGSKTKRRQFIHRFEERGIAASSIARMTCPIGLPGIDGKEPETIAAAVVAQLLMVSAGATEHVDRPEGHAVCSPAQTRQASEIDDGNHRHGARAAAAGGEKRLGFDAIDSASRRRAVDAAVDGRDA